MGNLFGLSILSPELGKASDLAYPMPVTSWVSHDSIGSLMSTLWGQIMDPERALRYMGSTALCFTEKKTREGSRRKGQGRQPTL